MGTKLNYSLFITSMIGYFLMSVTFLFMPLETLEESIDNYSNILGILFWVFLAIGVITQFVLSYRLKLWCRTDKNALLKSKRMSYGVIAFWKNPPARISDAVMLISIVGLVISILATDATGYMCYVFVSLLVFAFCSHCIFNGKIYHYLTNKTYK